MRAYNAIFLLTCFLMQIGCPKSDSGQNKPKSESPNPPIRALKPIFEVQKDGFSFANYGNQKGVQNLTPAIVEEFCGNGACASGTGDTCQLSGAMSAFLDGNNRSMSGGHCDGMAVVAQAIHMGKIPLNKYSSNALRTFDLKFTNPTLQSDIAKFFATQSMDPARSAEIRVSPSQVLNLIKQNHDSYTIGLYNSNGSNGHSVTAARVIDDNARYARIQIYDNNYPNQWRYIQVDKSTNTWNYDDYETGDARTKSLTLIPLESRFSPQQCPPMGNDDDQYEDQGKFEYYDDDQYEDDNSYEDDSYYRNKHHLKNHKPRDKDQSKWTLWLDGPGKLEVAPGTKTFPRRSDNFKRNALTPVYELDALKDNLVIISGLDFSAKEPTNVVMFRQGQSIAIEDLVLSKNQKNELKLPKDGSSLEYSTKQDETVTIRFGQTYKGADYEIKIRPEPQKGGYRLAINNVVDPKFGNHELMLVLEGSNANRSSFKLEILRIDDKNEQFENSDSKLLTISKNETLHIEYGKWIKDKQPLLILSDKDDDGKIEQVKKIKDEN